MTEKHSKYEVELLKLYRNTNERGRQLMFDLLTCFVSLGEGATV